MGTRDDPAEAARRVLPVPYMLDAEAGLLLDAILDALIQRVPSVCPSGFDWTTGDIEDWLRAVKEGRA